MDSQASSGSLPLGRARGARRTLEFITYTNPNMARSAANRQRVRSQAMRDFHGRSELPKRRKNEIELDISPLLQRTAESNGRTSSAERKAEGEATPPSPTTPLSVSRLDPFFKYPVSMGHRERELYDHLYDETCVMFRIMRNIGFLNRVRATLAFSQLLAMASWHLSHLNRDERTTEHLGYNLTATQQLQNQIGNPRESSTDDAIGAVLVFACCANLLHDTESLTIHMNGLKLLIEGRGGVHTLDSNYTLRTVLYWADINGAVLQDVAPRFPKPEHLLPRPSFRDDAVLSQAPSETLIARLISGFCSELQEVQDIMRAERRKRHLWDDPLFPGFHLSPVLGDLLAMRVEVDYEDIASVMLEAFRLAAILYVSSLRAKFGVDTLSADPVYGAKLRTLLMFSSLRQEAPPRLLVWILSTASSAEHIPAERNWFAEISREVLAAENIVSFEALLAIISQLVWAEDFLVYQTNILRGFF
ncbi:hypothetical protein NA57DRAFT_79143 [Rhizodiscina lignyota]|uniref:Uncharacterized protein n=1 Tax=Rhizodiscina lignyota TaxID=1504668 RepID=A0A9P4IBV4_9PEZI|nr:hypothetical protein NA57DRAFT_79143 [Rhizodiscina lignyota]